MKYTLADRVTALAGVFQAARLVQEIARSGQANAEDVETCLQALLVDNPASVLDVYGGDIKRLRSGLIAINEQLGLSAKREIDVTRYVMGMLFLERKLAKSPQMLQRIGSGLDGVHRQLDHFPLSHENILANLAGIYAETLSTLTFRIMVSGNPQQLANTEVANRIRALLLAGIRSAVLWHQTGGRRWHLLFTRSKIVDTCLQLMQAQESSPP